MGMAVVAIGGFAQTHRFCEPGSSGVSHHSHADQRMPISSSGGPEPQAALSPISPVPFWKMESSKQSVMGAFLSKLLSA